MWRGEKRNFRFCTAHCVSPSQIVVQSSSPTSDVWQLWNLAHEIQSTYCGLIFGWLCVLIVEGQKVMTRNAQDVRSVYDEEWGALMTTRWRLAALEPCSWDPKHTLCIDFWVTLYAECKRVRSYEPTKLKTNNVVALSRFSTPTPVVDVIAVVFQV